VNNLIWIPNQTVGQTLVDASRGETNWRSCVKFNYHGYEVSLALDSNHRRDANLVRGEFRVYQGEFDVTNTMFPNEQLLYGNVETLLRIFRVIDEYLKSHGVKP